MRSTRIINGVFLSFSIETGAFLTVSFLIDIRVPSIVFLFGGNLFLSVFLLGINQKSDTLAVCRLFERTDAAQLAGILSGLA
jgi:hypothetical protein